jgi:hypothetical protein
LMPFIAFTKPQKIEFNWFWFFYAGLLVLKEIFVISNKRFILI